MAKLNHDISIEQKAHTEHKTHINIECEEMNEIEAIKLLKDISELYRNVTRVSLTSEYIDVTLDI